MRVYNRALSAAEIQQDMSTAISNPDATPPSAPGTLTATGGLGQVNLSWGAATDNVGVPRYNVYRSTTPGFTPSRGQPDRPADRNQLHGQRARGRHLLLPGHRRGRGRQLSVRPRTRRARRQPRTRRRRACRAAWRPRPQDNTVNLSWNAATDNVGVARYNVYRSTTSGFTPSAANRIAQPTGPSYADSGLAPGTYYYKVTAEDAAGNVSGVSNEVNATVAANSGAGLVAAYGFDAGAGTSAVDPSGNGNTGTLANATWASGGKYGNALSFNGTNAWVTVNSSTSLALTNGMTVEAWVNPTTLGNAYRTVVFREQPGSEVYSLYANQSGNPQAPLGEVYVERLQGRVGLDRARHRQLDAPGRDLRRLVRAPVRERDARLDHRGPRIAGELDGAAPHRRKHHLGRVLQRPDRRGPRLQPRAERRRDPDWT